MEFHRTDKRETGSGENDEAPQIAQMNGGRGDDQWANELVQD